MVVQTREHQLDQSSQLNHLLTLSRLPLQWPLVSLHQRFHPLLLRSNSWSNPLKRPPQMHQLHRTLPLLDHLFTFWSLHIILVYIAPCFDVLYSGIRCITDDTSYIDIIFCLNLAFFYFLYSLTLLFFWNIWFLLYDSDSMSLRRYHFLLIFQSLLSHWGQCSAWLGGELRKEVFVNNAKLFW